MNLWKVSNGLDWELGGLFQHVWAWGADEAKVIGILAHDFQVEEESVEAEIEHDHGLCAEHQSPHRERRRESLRLLGWGCEDDDRCDPCGLAPFGSKEPGHQVCQECYQCGDCRAEDEECKECKPEVRTRGCS